MLNDDNRHKIIPSISQYKQILSISRKVITAQHRHTHTHQIRENRAFFRFFFTPHIKLCATYTFAYDQRTKKNRRNTIESNMVSTRLNSNVTAFTQCVCVCFTQLLESLPAFALAKQHLYLVCRPNKNVGMSKVLSWSCHVHCSLTKR